jgi:hypothetical protein
LERLSLPEIKSGRIDGANVRDVDQTKVIDGVINFAQLSPCDGFIFFSLTKKLH